MTPMQQEMPSALKSMKILDFFYFCGSFLPSWIRIQQLKLMRIHADPDPKPCLFGIRIRIQEGKNEPQKKKKLRNFLFWSAECSLLWELKASSVTWTSFMKA